MTNDVYEVLIAKIRAKSEEKQEGKKAKKTSSNEDYNSMFSAFLNSASHEVSIYKDGGEVRTNPSKEIRETIIKPILKKAGLDSSDIETFVENFEFPSNIPWKSGVDEVTYDYLKAGKAYTFARKENFNATLQIKTVEEREKPARSPQTGVTKMTKQGQFDKLVVKSVCPKNLRTNLD